jgi:hypothetical protein
MDKSEKGNKYPPPPPKQIPSLGLMDLKIYSLERNPRLWLDSWQSLKTFVKIMSWTSISGQDISAVYFWWQKVFFYTLKKTVCYLGYTGEKYPPLPNQNVQFTASLPPSSPSLNQIILFYFFIHKFALHFYFMHNFIFVLVLFFLTSYSPRPKRSSSMWSFVWNYK